MDQNTQRRIKYIFDRILGLVLFFILSPLMFIIAIVIKMDDGNSVFFKQRRPGLNGIVFTLWKFRTMIPEADDLLDENSRINQGINRITRVGRILRYMSLDELPQIINIIKGEMSFIGPRPALYESFERYTDFQKKRFLMKPGITGLAQVNGRNLLKWSKRIEYDIDYINNYSILQDLKILYKTIKVVVLREGIVLDRNPEQVDDLGEKKIYENHRS